jgi:hypothetical protein
VLWGHHRVSHPERGGEEKAQEKKEEEVKREAEASRKDGEPSRRRSAKKDSVCHDNK